MSGCRQTKVSLTTDDSALPEFLVSDLRVRLDQQKTALFGPSPGQSRQKDRLLSTGDRSKGNGKQGFVGQCRITLVGDRECHAAVGTRAGVGRLRGRGRLVLIVSGRPESRMPQQITVDRRREGGLTGQLPEVLGTLRSY